MNFSKYILYTSMIFLIASCSTIVKETTKRQLKQSNNELLELPSKRNGDQIIKHTHYTLSYNEEYEQPNWVVYELLRNEVEKNYSRVEHKFLPDFQVNTGSAIDDDYKGSGYDRGHLMPAAVCTWDSIAMKESFLFSNCSPQKDSFNRGAWSRLEKLERKLLKKHNAVWVVVIPIFNDIIEYIGESKVAVPGAYGRAFM